MDDTQTDRQAQINTDKPQITDQRQEEENEKEPQKDKKPKMKEEKDQKGRGSEPKKAKTDKDQQEGGEPLGNEQNKHKQQKRNQKSRRTTKNKNTTTTTTTNNNNRRQRWPLELDFCRFYNTHLQLTGNPQHSVSLETLTQKFKDFCVAHGSKSQQLHDKNLATSIGLCLASFGVRFISLQTKRRIDYSFVGLRYMEAEEAKTGSFGGGEARPERRLNTKDAKVEVAAKVSEAFKMEGGSEDSGSGKGQVFFPTSTASPSLSPPLSRLPHLLPKPKNPETSRHLPSKSEKGSSSLHLPFGSQVSSLSSLHFPSNFQASSSFYLLSDSQSNPTSFPLPSNPETPPAPLPSNFQAGVSSLHHPSNLQTPNCTTSSPIPASLSLRPVPIPDTPCHEAPLGQPSNPENPRTPLPITPQSPPVPLASCSSSYILSPVPQFVNQQYQVSQTAANTLQGSSQFSDSPTQIYCLQPATPFTIPSFPKVPPPFTPPPFSRPPETVNTPIHCLQYAIPPPSSNITISESPVFSPCFLHIPPPLTPSPAAPTSDNLNTPLCSPVPPHFPPHCLFSPQ